jgi:phosphoenolpyruvate synthase/pyruvate phosphate dikinase
MNPVLHLSESHNVSQFGGKAANLASMVSAGLPVPAGIAVSLAAFDETGKLGQESKQKIEELLDQTKLYAVRSSALAEDAKGASWAGQFETFLNTATKDVITKVEECHNSTKKRAKAYASEQANEVNFNIAVVVQEMVKPDYAGVMFTKDPVSGADTLVTEYVEGLGEELVSGRADPVRITWKFGEVPDAPFNIEELTKLAQKVEEVFGSPQDIEWAWASNKMWLVQTRPITATQTTTKGYYLGEPEDLFYWGPSRAQPLYMSDFMAAAETFFKVMAADTNTPNPPKSLVLFYDSKMVWLSDAKAFAEFTAKTFDAYQKAGRIDEDIANWRKACQNSKDLLGAWSHTLFAEFSLYGAETVLARQLQRFEESVRQKIWGTFTVPDNSTFLARIDEELLASKDPKAVAAKYPWIQDGYDGISDKAEDYFIKRLKTLNHEHETGVEQKPDRVRLAEEFGLSDEEVTALTLTRKLAQFMDDRKAWMMQTRKLIIEPFTDIQYGWSFDDGIASKVSETDTKDLWQRYVDFRASTNATQGIVASNGGKHFVNGEVVIVSSPTANVARDKILVVPSTSPSYVPLMRKAKALVTDHGGMMSHAAIVAREFGLPCIVGTKQATKVLKDGDHVVLDLVKGEVNR